MKGFLVYTWKSEGKTPVELTRKILAWFRSLIAKISTAGWALDLQPSVKSRRSTIVGNIG